MIVQQPRRLAGQRFVFGKLLAQQLGIGYYDREILQMAARESGLCPEVFERTDEKNRFLHTLGNIIPFVGSGNTYVACELSNEHLFLIQSEAIRKAAAQGSCIFIGRCADYVLRDHPRCVNIFISADMPDRISRLCRLTDCTEKKAREMIEKGDRQRAAFYNFYSSGTWGAAATYHLCINSSVLGIERTADFIRRFVSEKLGLKD